MNLKEQQNQLKKLSYKKPSILGLDEVPQFAVCIPLIETKDGYDILFEVRSMKLVKQPGDVCFPGGFVEPGEIPYLAAIRETEEELLIKKKQIHIEAGLDLLFNGRMVMYPYVGILKDYQGTFSSDEVDHVFRVPLSYILTHEPEVYEVDAKVIPPENFPYEKIQKGRDYQWRSRKETVYFYEYEDHVIWGLTARILHAFATKTNCKEVCNYVKI